MTSHQSNRKPTRSDDYVREPCRFDRKTDFLNKFLRKNLQNFTNEEEAEKEKERSLPTPKDQSSELGQQKRKSNTASKSRTSRIEHSNFKQQNRKDNTTSYLGISKDQSSKLKQQKRIHKTASISETSNRENSKSRLQNRINNTASVSVTSKDVNSSFKQQMRTNDTASCPETSQERELKFTQQNRIDNAAFYPKHEDSVVRQKNKIDNTASYPETEGLPAKLNKSHNRGTVTWEETDQRNSDVPKKVISDEAKKKASFARDRENPMYQSFSSEHLNFLIGSKKRMSQVLPSSDLRVQNERMLYQSMKLANISEKEVESHIRGNNYSKLLAGSFDTTDFIHYERNKSFHTIGRNRLAKQQSLLQQIPSVLKTSYERNKYEILLEKFRKLEQTPRGSTKPRTSSESHSGIHISSIPKRNQAQNKQQHNRFETDSLGNNFLKFYLRPKGITNVLSFLEKERERRATAHYYTAMENQRNGSLRKVKLDYGKGRESIHSKEPNYNEDLYKHI